MLPLFSFRFDAYWVVRQVQTPLSLPIFDFPPAGPAVARSPDPLGRKGNPEQLCRPPSPTLPPLARASLQEERGANCFVGNIQENSHLMSTIS